MQQPQHTRARAASSAASSPCSSASRRSSSSTAVVAVADAGVMKRGVGFRRPGPPAEILPRLVVLYLPQSFIGMVWQ